MVNKSYPTDRIQRVAGLIPGRAARNGAALRCWGAGSFARPKSAMIGDTTIDTANQIPITQRAMSTVHPPLAASPRLSPYPRYYLAPTNTINRKYVPFLCTRWAVIAQWAVGRSSSRVSAR